MSYDLHVWYKPSAVPFVCNTWRPDLEYIAVGRRKGVRLLNAPLCECSKVWIGAPPGRRQHAAQAGRQAIGIERDLGYCRLIAQRLQSEVGTGS